MKSDEKGPNLATSPCIRIEDLYAREGRPMHLDAAHMAGNAAELFEAGVRVATRDQPKEDGKTRRMKAKITRKWERDSLVLARELHFMVDLLCAGGQLDSVLVAKQVLGGLINGASAQRFVRRHNMATEASAEYPLPTANPNVAACGSSAS
jgi:hypothetical protein